VCRRRWEAEAARDGRLTGAALASLLQHASQCKDCGREQRALEELGTALVRANVPTDEVGLRRVREQLLERAAVRSYGASVASRWWWVAAAAAVLGLVLVVIAGKLYLSRGHTAYTADITASPKAAWSRQIAKDTEQVMLNDGVLTLTVHRSANARRVSVRVPDGVIDDMGTVFRVTVRDGHTREIVVREGAVVFRRPGAQPLVLSSPSVWVPPGEISRPRAQPTDRANDDAAVPAPAPRSPPASHSASAKRRGASSTGNASPADEDFAYLRIVALRREGRSDEARLAAAEYLRSFPNGFRRTEVLALMREPR
jgi:hypothetical protein